MPENQDLNEQVEEIVDESAVITVPIDDSLTHSNEAADAAAVGAALALKADRSQISTISVNGQSADNQGVIIVTAEDTQLSDTDTTTIKSAVDTLAARTAEDILMETGSQETVADAISQVASTVSARTADQIAMSATDPTTIASAMSGKLGPADIDDTLTIEGKAADAEAVGTAISSAVSGVEEEISALDERTDALESAAVRSVNSVFPGASGDVHLNEVPYAGNLVSDAAQVSEDAYFARTSGASLSIPDGDAWLMRISGRRIHTGVVEEVTQMDVHSERPEPGEGEDPETPITAAIDWDVFKEYVTQSASLTFTYTSGAWTADLSLYGITVSGTPEDGDYITVTYVKGNRGLITQSFPAAFISTGWNLYDSVNKYARVVKYSEVNGFGIDGAYTSLSWSETPDGPQTPISVANGAFNVPGDGYVHVVGGTASGTAIWMQHTDWSSGYQGDFETYRTDTISISSVMTDYFPYGLMQVGAVSDTIDLNTLSAVNRVERLAYSQNAIDSLNAQGRAWEADENYIYAVLTAPVQHVITLDGAYVANDHGMEIIEGGSVAPLAATMYGNNLKNKLEKDVLTLSQQTLETAQQNQVRANIKATKALTVDMGTISALPVTKTAVGVTEKMVCVASDLGTASAQTGDWTITTATDSVTISGTISGSTTVKLVLIEQDAVTATTT